VPGGWWWAILTLSACAAILFPLLQDPVLHAEDVSTPTPLRTWAEDGRSVAYRAGEYHILQAPGNGFPFVLHDLPRTVDGLSIAVRARVVDGSAGVIAVDCVSEFVESAPNGDGTTSIEETSYYTFLVEPSTGSFAIATGGGSVLREGRIPWDPADGLLMTCVGRGEDTLLSLGSGSGTPIAAVDENGIQDFRAISLGVTGKGSSAHIAFDDLRVTEANAEGGQTA
jgi:hypothetical protein